MNINLESWQKSALINDSCIEKHFLNWPLCLESICEDTDTHPGEFPLFLHNIDPYVDVESQFINRRKCSVEKFGMLQLLHFIMIEHKLKSWTYSVVLESKNAAFINNGKENVFLPFMEFPWQAGF